MNLCADIGNQRLKIGLFTGPQLVRTEVWDKEAVKDILKQHRQQGVSSLIMTSTSVTKEEMQDVLHSFDHHLWLDHRTPLPLANAYQTPHTLGTDRMAAAVGAWSEAPGHNILIIDAGTCVTYDIVSAAGIYEGGNIAPGLRMRLQAMHEFTQRLPLVDIPLRLPWLGRNTTEALQAGGVGGMLLEMGGMITRYRRRLENLKVFLTGGDANFFGNHLKRRIFVSPELVLKGLNQILLYNLRHE